MATARTATTAAAPTRPQEIPLLAALAVVGAIVTATFWPVLSAQAVLLDDYQFWIDNPLVQRPGWDAAHRFLSEVFAPSTVKGYYKPATMISLMLDRAAGGSPHDLTAFHRTHLALHVATTLLVIVLLYQLFGQLWAAALVGLLFGVHPLAVEPVAWVAERKTMLATCAALGSLVAYVAYTRRRRWSWYLTCAVLLVLALLSKPTAVPLPVLFLLLNYWPLRRLSWTCLLEKVPLLAISSACALITIASQAQAAGLDSPAKGDSGRVLLAVAHNIAFYVATTLWPFGLTWHYPYPEPISGTNPAYLVGLIATPLILLAVLGSWVWTRAIVVGVTFWLIAIFPTLGFIGFTYIIAAHKFMYLPVLGLLLPLTALLIRITDRQHAPAQRAIARTAIALVTMAIAGLLILQTQRDLRIWRTSESLFRHMLAARPDAHAIRYSLGITLERASDIDEAATEYTRVIAAEPGHFLARGALGVIRWRQGDLEAAAAQLEAALAIRPEFFEARYHLAQVLAQRADLKGAIPHFVQAAQLAPQHAEVRRRLGLALAGLERHDDALSAYALALELRPSHALTHVNRAVSLTRVGRIDEALAAYRQALQLDPDNAFARQQLEALQVWQQQRQPTPETGGG